MIQKERVVKARGIQDIEKLINKLTQGKPYVVVNSSERRSIDISNDTLEDIVNVLATLINDLKDKGIIQK
jgi:methionine synthase II (cobalamin-independent)